MSDLSGRLQECADGDLREHARDSLIGIHPDARDLRQWADLMDEAAAEIVRLRTVTPAMIAAAWATWKPRHKDRLGPGPAFREAIEAAIAAAGVPVRGEEG